ncbi:hypothetical protein MRX96_019314 [Rhipicephalus microplus]
MDNLFRGMRHVAVYLDDILVTGLAPAPHKVEAVLKAPKPQNKKELQSYLGLINFYRTFLPNLSSHLQPLHLLLRDGQQWAWRKEQDLAFQRSKELITKAPVLVHVNPAKPVILTVDASPYGVGAALAHREKNDQERPISFVSRRLYAAEQRYSQLDKEGLALMFRAERFHQYLWGRRFEAVMDHKPLLGLLGPDKAVRVQASPGVVRWALKLAAYSYQLVYRSGKDLAPTDALSRLPLPEVPAAVPEPAEVWSRRCPEGEELAERTYSHKPAELSLQQGCLLWGSRVVIPQSLRSRVLQLLHAGHPGVEKTKIVARSHVWWPGLNQDIARMVQSCQACQENQRASRHVKITPWPFPEKPWSRLPVNFGGPLQGPLFPGGGGHFLQVGGASASSLLVRMSDGTTWHRHADHVRPRLATSAAAPSGSQQAREPSAVTDASTAPGAGATRTTVTPPASPRTPARRADSATATQAAPDVATPATPVLRRSARHRRPPDRYLPG